MDKNHEDKQLDEMLHVWFKTPTTEERVKNLESELNSLNRNFEEFKENIFFLNALLTVNAFVLTLIFIAVLNI